MHPPHTERPHVRLTRERPLLQRAARDDTHARACVVASTWRGGGFTLAEAGRENAILGLGNGQMVTLRQVLRVYIFHFSEETGRSTTTPHPALDDGASPPQRFPRREARRVHRDLRSFRERGVSAFARRVGLKARYSRGEGGCAFQPSPTT